MNAAGDPAYLDYRVHWRTPNTHPGRHASGQSGQGGDFRAHRPFWQLPDAARIDIRRSILDPAGQLLVRQTEQRGAITVAVAADISRSMHAGPGGSRIACAAALADAAARTALRAGDAFCLVPFDDLPCTDLSLGPTRSRAACARALENLAYNVPRGRSSEGLLGLAAHLPARRCLLLIASDFLMPHPILERALASLAVHDIVPIVLHRPSPPAKTGLYRLRDSETGATRLLLMRPALHRKWQYADAARRQIQAGIFGRYCRAPVHVMGKLDTRAVSQELMAC